MTRDEVFKVCFSGFYYILILSFKILYILQLVREAAFLAIYRDGSSGGVIRMADITASGIARTVGRFILKCLYDCDNLI